jgi:predicted deacylase
VLYADYLARWKSSVRAPAQLFSYGSVLEGGRELELTALRLPGPRTVLVTAGFHGDEKAGPLTLAEHVAEIVDYAAARNVGLRIYPCINPSGFEAHVRYNVSGERPNNDFLRYETSPGAWAGELRAGQPFLRIVGATDGLPKETAALARALDAEPTPQASLDLHQDNFIPGSLFYAYVFGDFAAYRPLMAKAGAKVAILHSCVVDSGWEPGSDVRADPEGFIICHDGSITDKYGRAGVPYTAAIETTTQTPAPLADEVNLIWIYGFIDLVAGLRP